MNAERAAGRTEPGYQESLWAPWWLWLVVMLLAASAGVAYGYAFGFPAGWLVGLAVFALLAFGLWRATLRVAVDSEGLRAGRAVLPPDAIGRVAALDAEQMARARGPGSDARSYFAVRSLVCPGGVIVEVTDLADPHPWWVISSRQPTSLAEAIEVIRTQPAADLPGVRSPRKPPGSDRT